MLKMTQISGIPYFTGMRHAAAFYTIREDVRNLTLMQPTSKTCQKYLDQDILYQLADDQDNQKSGWPEVQMARSLKARSPKSEDQMSKDQKSEDQKPKDQNVLPGSVGLNVEILLRGVTDAELSIPLNQYR